jgi:putative endonuclease
MDKEGAHDVKTDTRIFFVYIVRCRDGTLYTGFTCDVLKRVATHNSGKGAKYTRSRLPVHLLTVAIISARGVAAMRMERRSKNSPRKKRRH